MEPVASNIQVLLQAAEFLERREREAEHGYASLCPHRSPGSVHRRRKRSPQASGAPDSGRSVHNELEKRRRAQLKRCLEQLKQQMPLGSDCARYTTLSLLRRARMHIQKLEEQEQRARRLKEKLRSRQQSLRQQLEQLRAPLGAGERERVRADSLDSSGLSSERSDSDQGECPEVEGWGEWWARSADWTVPVQRNWRWTWRAWCLGVQRPSCCQASVRVGSTVTHTVVPGYDPQCPKAPLPRACPPPSSTREEPYHKPQGLLGVTSSWNGLKGHLHGHRRFPALRCCHISPRGGACRQAGRQFLPELSFQAVFCSTWLHCLHGDRKPLGPSCPFLDKAPWPLPILYSIFIKRLFLNFLSMVLPHKNRGTSSHKLGKRK